MKKSIFYSSFILFYTFLHAQTFDFGVKAGLLMDSNNEITLNSVGSSANDTATNNLNFHAGFYGVIGLTGYFIQPELYYAQVGKKFEVNGNKTTIINKRIDLPILVGMKLAMVRFYAGPVFSTYLDDKVKTEDYTALASDDFTVGLQAGVGVNVKKIKFDLRIDQSVSQRTLSYLSKGDTFFVSDNRPRLILLSVGYDLF
jgi:hypothetical protein